MSNSVTITLGGMLIASVMFSSPAAASSSVDLSNQACRPDARIVEVETLTPASWQQLVAINDNVNATITPETDEDNYRLAEYWTYPVNGRGDCEDIALEKQRQLINAGWDPSTLLMTVVRERDGNGHAVLMVRTDRGDLILDNQVGRVLVWKDTDYEYVKRQSQADAGKWVGLVDDRATVVAARR
jgi:predicted transglutaminase-like cysteine proteinase